VPLVTPTPIRNSANNAIAATSHHPKPVPLRFGPPMDVPRDVEVMGMANHGALLSKKARLREEA
jgi:hypothetical protein